MKFKQEAKTGKIVILFSWKERIKLLFKPTITLSFEGSKHAINHLIRCLFEWVPNLPKELQNKMSDGGEDIK
jgi:hypothetical protein|tara:strand:- start:212 stop:427 length:216 start_codon:yes stop_codon:yes gene_type:complete